MAEGITLSSAHTLTISPTSGNNMGAVTVTFNVNNAGESSDYSFTFNTFATTAKTDYFLIKFPRIYDEYVSGYWPTEQMIRYKNL